MSERITEADLKRLEKRTDSFGLVAEVRRLRALIVLAVEEGEDMGGNPPPEVEAEYKAIRAEEGK